MKLPKKILNENLKQRQHKEQELIKKADSEKPKLEKLDIIRNTSSVGIEIEKSRSNEH